MFSYAMLKSGTGTKFL